MNAYHKTARPQYLRNAVDSTALRTTERAMREPDRTPKPGRFVPVPLTSWETWLHRAVWISHAFIAFLVSYQVSHGFIKQWIQHFLQPTSYPWLTSVKMDLSDSEWIYYRKSVVHLIGCYALNSLLYYSLPRVLPASVSRWAVIVAGVATNFMIASPTCIGVLSLFSLVPLSLTLLTRSQWPAWLLCIAFILTANDHLPFTYTSFIYYREFNIYLYGAIRILNLCIQLTRDLSSAPSTPFTRNYLQLALIYLTYLPYGMTLIVLFDDFSKQYTEREKRIATGARLTENVKSLISRASRLLLWFFVFEALLHFIHVNALFQSPFTIINSLNNYQISCVSYVCGQFFHIKYVIIFGVPSFFALVDGMSPPAPPICISRVSRYSRMWRHFDVGLYQFLKNQVYVPLLTSPIGKHPLTRLLSLVCVFSVVLAWHGTRSHYIYWVILSAFELIIERIGAKLWDTVQFQQARQSIGEKTTRRIVALGMLFTVIPGIFGVFFFLGQEGVGEIVFQRVLVEGMKGIMTLDFNMSITPGLVFLHLLTLGYFYNNYCLDFDMKNKLA